MKDGSAGDGVKPDFVNYYDADGHLELGISKTMLGKDVSAGQFEFNLTEYTDDTFTTVRPDMPAPLSTCRSTQLSAGASSEMKFSALDNRQEGIEMESDKPGWNDATNGLPGLFASGVSESVELLRLIRYTEKHLAPFGDHTVSFLPEQEKLWNTIAIALTIFRKLLSVLIKGKPVSELIACIHNVDWIHAYWDSSWWDTDHVNFLGWSMGTAYGIGLNLFSGLMLLFMNLVEVLVAFVQAYVFTLLSAVFIGLSRPEHHHAE